MRRIWAFSGAVSILCLAVWGCKSTSPTVIIPGPQLSVSVDSIDGIPNTPDAITQATPVPLSLRMHIDSLADSSDTVKTLLLNKGDGQSKQWTGLQIPIGLDISYNSWWVRAGLCTLTVAATTAKGIVSDTSIVCRVLTRAEYDSAFAKRLVLRSSQK